MIAYLMRRNLPELRAVFFSIAAASAFYLLPQVALAAGIPFFVIAWAALPQRASVFDAALPIRGREIAVAQILWALPLLWLPLIACGISPVGMAEPRVPIRFLLDAAAAIALATMLPYTVRPSQISDLPFWILGAIWAGVAAITAATVYLLPPDVALEALLVATAIAARVVWVTVPDVMELSPRHTKKAKPAKLVLQSSALGKGGAWRAWKPLLWSMFNRNGDAGASQPYLLLIMYAAILLMSMEGGGQVRIYFFVYIATPLGVARAGTRWLAAFPLSNRFRLWSVLFPSLVLGLVFMTIGGLVGPLVIHEKESMSRRAPAVASDRESVTRVPLEYWQSAGHDESPKIVSPWGDVTTADTFTVAGALLYNPYTTRSGDSDRFIEWQLARATTAVYGRAFTVDDYKRREREGTLPSRIRDTGAMTILNFSTIIALGLLMVFATELSNWYRIAGRSVLTFAFAIPVVLPFLAYFGIELKYGRYPASEVVGPLYERALWPLAQRLPSSPFVVSVIAAIPILALYALLERQFGVAESLQPQKSRSKLGRALTRPLPHFHES